jgi:hypothetical protein
VHVEDVADRLDDRCSAAVRRTGRKSSLTCQEPPLERREAAIGGARLTAAPQEPLGGVGPRTPARRRP